MAILIETTSWDRKTDSKEACRRILLKATTRDEATMLADIQTAIITEAMNLGDLWAFACNRLRAASEEKP